MCKTGISSADMLPLSHKKYKTSVGGLTTHHLHTTILFLSLVTVKPTILTESPSAQVNVCGFLLFIYKNTNLLGSKGRRFFVFHLNAFYLSCPGLSLLIGRDTQQAPLAPTAVSQVSEANQS